MQGYTWGPRVGQEREGRGEAFIVVSERRDGRVRVSKLMGWFESFQWARGYRGHPSCLAPGPGVTGTGEQWLRV